MRVVCIGECMVEFARRDDGLWQQGFAGDSLNVAWALRALLPAEAEVAYLTRVGTDALSDAMVAMLQTAGIATALIQRDAMRTVGLYTIQTDATGERSFSYWRSDSAARRLADDPALLASALANADLVYLSGITLAILPPASRAHLMSALGARGNRRFTVAFDPNLRPRLWEAMDTARAAIDLAARSADILLPTHEDEALAFADPDPATTRDRYARLGVAETVVKDGARPTLWRAADQQGACPVTAAPRVIDTTGAGDSFNGAYLAARLMGASPETAIGQAQRVSAFVVGSRGALLAPGALRAASQPPPRA
ncbi:sugar kinase [Tabrizicola sp. BL-A-41-H6]|uniref:sugar kinase n=1 Tax=Tabrizicola sp. BL-A-41-H6 TaxID=3421107 RepID=UPI003D67E6E6